MNTFGNLFWINVSSFLLYGILLILEALSFNALNPLMRGVVFVIALPLISFNVLSIAERMLRKTWDTLEKISLVAVFALLLQPLLVTIEYSLLGIVSREIIVLNTLITFLVAITVNPHFLGQSLSTTSLIRANATWPLIGAIFCYFTTYIIIVSSYPTLPDSDPYYWLLKIRDELDANQLATLGSYRPLLSSFTYIFSISIAPNIFTFFKFVIPGMFLLILLPSLLIATQYRHPRIQLMLLLLPLSSASTILYYTLPIPQAIFSICLIFSLQFTVYSWLTKQTYFHLIGGLILILAYFYHEMSVLLFTPWLIGTLWLYRNGLKNWILDHKTTSLLLAILFISHGEKFLPMLLFFKNWGVRILHSMSNWHSNWSFPLTYVNIDGRSVGWGNGIGLLKYYTYYVGPAVAVACVLLLYLVWKNRHRLRSIRPTDTPLILALLFVFFFTLAEVLPRLLSIAFLPERAWGFAGVILLLLVPVMMPYLTLGQLRVISVIFCLTIGINIIAATYVNSLKKHLVPAYALPSAKWIESELSDESTILTSRDWSILRTFTNKHIVDVQNSALYTDLTVLDRTILTTVQEQCSVTTSHTHEQWLQIQESVSLLGGYLVSDLPSAIRELDKISQEVTVVKSILDDSKAPKEVPCEIENVYVYFSKENPLNPYVNRPYSKAGQSFDILIFDQLPDKFRRVYSAPGDEIVLWKVLQ